MSSKKVKPEKKKSRGSYETVELPAQEVKKALAQLQAVAVSERENREDREDRDGESFESKIERAMQKIVSDTVGDEPIDHISSAQRAPKAKTAGTVKVARAKGIRLDESLVRKEGVPEEKEAAAAKEPEVPRPQKKAREEMPVNIQEKTFERCFPFGILGKRIVLYAAGKYGNQLYDMIDGRPDRTVVQWVDKNHEEITNDKMKIAGLKELGQAAYDSVLIAVVDRLAAEGIRVDLMKQGVPAHKIVWFDKREIYRYLIGNQIFRWM